MQNIIYQYAFLDVFSFVSVILCERLCLIHHCTYASPSTFRRVPHMEQTLLSLPEHLSSPPLFYEVRVVQYSFLFCGFLVVFLRFSQIVAHDLIHNELLPKEHFGFNFFHPKQIKILGGS